MGGGGDSVSHCEHRGKLVNRYANQIAKLLNNEGRMLAKKYGLPAHELITAEELATIAIWMVEGIITKAQGRKLFCDKIKESV
jgi:hypothetical protein